jgi:uncharacterized small protein (DUF1192 family)
MTDDAEAPYGWQDWGLEKPKAKIERLRAEHKAAELLWWDEKGELEDRISDLQAEIERLQSECDEHAGAYRRCSEERAKLQAVVDRVGRLQGCCSEHTINDCLKYGCDLAALEDSGER